MEEAVGQDLVTEAPEDHKLHEERSEVQTLLLPRQEAEAIMGACESTWTTEEHEDGTGAPC